MELTPGSQDTAKGVGLLLPPAAEPGGAGTGRPGAREPGGAGTGRPGAREPGCAGTGRPGAREVRRLASIPRLAWAVAALVAIPVGVFLGAYLAGGHLLLSGDNLFQNYPLHVLVGRELRAGSLPFWNPFIWSGTPLLSELNPSTFYPTTLLFALLSPHVAWMLGEMFIFSVGAVGTCLLFADCGMSPVAAFLGAAVFAFGGAFLTQASVHSDMADGLVAFPWALLAVGRIVSDGRWRWSVLLGASFVLAVLSGSPEATMDLALVSFCYGLLRCGREPACWRALLTRSVPAIVVAVGLTAPVWLPALHFVAASQRSTLGGAFGSNYAFPPRAGLLALVPYLESGSALFGGPAYFGQSNLGEVGVYIGILPVIAVLALLSPTWGRLLPGGERRSWYGVLVVGILLAVGAGTPLEHLLQHIPFYGRQRNSGRNVIDVDLAAAALFGWWIDAGARLERGRRLRSETLASLLPFLAVTGLGLWFALAPASLWRALSALPPASPAPGARAAVGAALAVAAGFAALAAAAVWARERLSRRTWLAGVALVSAAELAVFSTGSGFAFSQSPPSSFAKSPAMRLVASHLSPGGRYGFVDSDLFGGGLGAGGEPDDNVLLGVPSISGYGAIVGSLYATKTGSHTRAGLKNSSIPPGLFDPIGLQVIVTVPETFLIPIVRLPGPGPATRSIVPVLEAAGTDPALPAGNVPAPELPYNPLYVARPTPGISSGHRFAWFFGTALPVSRAELVFTGRTDGQLVRTGLLGSRGAVVWQRPQRLGTSSTADLSLHPTAGVGGARTGGPVGLAVELLEGRPLPAAHLAVAVSRRSYVVAGPLARTIEPGAWRYVGSAGGMTVFQSRFAPKEAWVQPAAIAAAPGSSRLVSSTTYDRSAEVLKRSLESGTARVVRRSAGGGSVTIDVRAGGSGGVLVWDTAWSAGWHAVVSSPGRAARAVAPRRVGLVLGVDVPSGRSVVRLAYVPPGWVTGVHLALAAIALMVLFLAAVAIRSVRLRRRSTAQRMPPCKGAVAA